MTKDSDIEEIDGSVYLKIELTAEQVALVRSKIITYRAANYYAPPTESTFLAVFNWIQRAMTQQKLLDLVLNDDMVLDYMDGEYVMQMPDMPKIVD